jgi:hypothetical protein
MALLTVAFSPNECWVAAGSVQGTVRLWTAATGEPLALPLTGHKNSVSSVVFSPQGDWLASGADDGTMRLWRLDLSWTARGGARPKARLAWRSVAMAHAHRSACPARAAASRRGRRRARFRCPPAARPLVRRWRVAIGTGARAAAAALARSERTSADGPWCVWRAGGTRGRVGG